VIRDTKEVEKFVMFGDNPLLLEQALARHNSEFRTLLDRGTNSRGRQRVSRQNFGPVVEDVVKRTGTLLEVSGIPEANYELLNRRRAVILGALGFVVGAVEGGIRFGNIYDILYHGLALGALFKREYWSAL
jgi:hypothetical protein